MEATRQERERVVREHMDAEAEHAFGRALATFSHARYEIVPTQEVLEGPQAVRAFYEETHVAFPDFRFENTRMHHTDEAVFVETEFVGTHRGDWRGLPATNRRVRYRMCNVFEFDGVELVCERLFFDILTIMRQLGIARDPTSIAGRINVFLSHPVAVGRAFARSLRRSR